MSPKNTPLTLSTFTTERLCCRIAEPSDLDDIFAMYSREEVTRHLPYDTWQNADNAKEWWQKTQARHERGEARQYVLQLNSSNAVIGSFILFGFTSECGAELGYSLHSDFWGKGLMQEALLELIRRCHSELKLKQLIARVETPNVASQKLLARLGFEQVDRYFENDTSENTIELVKFHKRLH